MGRGPKPARLAGGPLNLRCGWGMSQLASMVEEEEVCHESTEVAITLFNMRTVD